MGVAGGGIDSWPTKSISITASYRLPPASQPAAAPFRISSIGFFPVISQSPMITAQITISAHCHHLKFFIHPFLSFNVR